MAKTEKETITAGLIEERLRTRAQSKLKADISMAASPLLDIAKRWKVGSVVAALDRVESELYQALLAGAEAREIEEFIKVNEATRELLKVTRAS